MIAEPLVSAPPKACYDDRDDARSPTCTVDEHGFQPAKARVMKVV